MCGVYVCVCECACVCAFVALRVRVCVCVRAHLVRSLQALQSRCLRWRRKQFNVEWRVRFVAQALQLKGIVQLLVVRGCQLGLQLRRVLQCQFAPRAVERWIGL